MKKTKKILKLICGAGNENFSEIEKLSFIYALAGFNMIDTSSNIKSVEAVKSGIKKAGKTNEISLCVSIGLQDDIHLSKAVINNQKCTKCGLCINICGRNAIFKEANKFIVNEKECIGCSKCIKNCKQNAIIRENKYQNPAKMLMPVLDSGIDCVEFHCTSSNERLIKESFQEIKSLFKGQLSICMSRLKFGDEKIISLLKQMTAEREDTIIQADGNPMSGSVNDFKSNIQTVSFAELIRNSGINSTLILSGGTNKKTSEFAKICDISIDGVAVGSFARKTVKEYIIKNDFWENTEIIGKAVENAKSISNSLLQYL